MSKPGVLVITRQEKCRHVGREGGAAPPQYMHRLGYDTMGFLIEVNFNFECFYVGVVLVPVTHICLSCWMAGLMLFCKSKHLYMASSRKKKRCVRVVFNQSFVYLLYAQTTRKFRNNSKALACPTQCVSL